MLQVTSIYGGVEMAERADLSGEYDLDTAHTRLSFVATSIDTGVAQRNEHLRSNDFFDMANFPELAFRCSAVDCLDETTFKVIEALTVKAVTRPITLDVEYSGTANDPLGINRIGCGAAMTINCKD